MIFILLHACMFIAYCYLLNSKRLESVITFSQITIVLTRYIILSEFIMTTPAGQSVIEWLVIPLNGAGMTEPSGDVPCLEPVGPVGVFSVGLKLVWREALPTHVQPPTGEFLVHVDGTCEVPPHSHAGTVPPLIRGDGQLVVPVIAPAG